MYILTTLIELIIPHFTFLFTFFRSTAIKSDLNLEDTYITVDESNCGQRKILDLYSSLTNDKNSVSCKYHFLDLSPIVKNLRAYFLVLQNID